MILKQRWGLKFYKVCINDALGLTLIHVVARVNLDTYAFERGKLLKSHLMGAVCSK